jgi:magnesium-transporting ATPase (P-type)
LALVPLAYACAIAAITARGMLVKSGSAIDALAACKTIALDKTGTITTGSLNLAEGFIISTVDEASSGGSSSSWQAPAHVRAMHGLAGLPQKAAVGSGTSSSSNSRGGALGTTTAFGSSGRSVRAAAAYDSNGFEAAEAAAAAGSGGSDGGFASSGGFGSSGVPQFDSDALKCAVALSRLSNHPVSRAMVDSAPHVDGDVSVLSFEQVRQRD